MERKDFLMAYSISVDEYIKGKKYIPEPTIANGEFSDPLYSDMFNTNDTIGLKSDYGKAVWFSRCYEVTMTYLLAKQDIKNKYQNGDMTHEESRQLLGEIDKIKDLGSEIFNFMNDRYFYAEDESTKYFYSFWDAFYNNKQCDMHDLARNFKGHIQTIRDSFEKRDEMKMSSIELGESCLKIASANELSKIVRLALNVENKNIIGFKEHINNIEQLIDDVRHKHAIETCLTEKGFITHYAFALRRDKVRDNNSNAVERRILSTPGIHNKVAQEFIHVGIGKYEICSTPQQITYGKDKGKEIIMDAIRCMNNAYSGAEKIKGNISKVLSFFMKSDDYEEKYKNMMKIKGEIENQCKSKMPQTFLGNKRNIFETEGIALRILTLNTKLENDLLTDKERKELDLLLRTYKIIESTVIDSVKHAMNNDLNFKNVINSLSSEMEKHGIELFDGWRYEDLTIKNGYERDMSRFLLITHLITNGELEKENNRYEYDEAVKLLEDMFGETIREQEEQIEIDI